MTDPRFTAIPDQGWEAVDEALSDHALEVVQKTLEDPNAVDYLHRYYDRGGNYAGATFIDLDPVRPWDITTADLLSLTLLSVEAPPYSVRRLLEPSPDRNQVLRLLSEDNLPLDADLATADAATLLAMAALHQALKSCLSAAHVKAKNPWVTASKLCARKRPDLFPVRDNVVCGVLGLGHNYQIDWQVFRRIIQDRGVRNRLDGLVDAAAARGADIGHPNRRLRHLDALIWMRAARHGCLAVRCLRFPQLSELAWRQRCLLVPRRLRGGRTHFRGDALGTSSDVEEVQKGPANGGLGARCQYLS